MRSEIWRHFDFWLMGAMALLIIIGVAMINSSIAGNIELVENNTTGRHILFALVGFGVIIVTTYLDYHLWVTISRILYLLLFVLFFIILFFGEALFGAQRSLDLGFLIIQPSELAKLAIIVLLADFFQRHQGRIGNLNIVVRSGLLTAPLVILIILQPDLSTSIVLMVIWFALLWAAGLEVKHLALFATVGLLVTAVAIPFLADYQQQRIINFVFPDPDATFGENYNVNQALITVGSGGLLGQGYGQGSQVQLRFLKVRWSDFIFSSIANELGFVGSLVIMGLLFFVIWRCLRAARLAPDTTGALIAYGVATWIAFQAIVNIGMNLNLLPRYRFAFAIRKSWGQRPVIIDARHRTCSERSFTTANCRKLISRSTMTDTSQAARVRFAPSPTGLTHLGSARTALYNYLLAKQTSGQFVLRIEDTDSKRYVAEGEDDLKDSLKWLGIPWDEGVDVDGPHAPYRQSERKAIYQEHAQELMGQRPCFLLLLYAKGTGSCPSGTNQTQRANALPRHLPQHLRRRCPATYRSRRRACRSLQNATGRQHYRQRRAAR